MGDLGIIAEDGLREFVLRPPGPAAEFSAVSAEIATQPRLRIIGPGRFERGYLERLSGLTAELEIAREREHVLSEDLREGQAALEMSQRVEHGCQRRIDRLEGRLEERTQALLESERQHKRLALALGAMQRENEMLRAHLPLALASASPRGLPSAERGRSPEPKPRTGLWSWIFQRRRRC